MATIYSLNTGDTITAGLPSSARCDEALNIAKIIAREKGQTVILDDDERGELLIGPRGGVRRFTRKLKLKFGFYDTREVR